MKHLVRVSCWLASSGADQGSIFEMHGTTEVELATIGGLAVTTLRPADFMQNLLNSAGTVKGQAAIYSALNADTKVASIDAYDIANTAASILTAPIAAHAGMGYTLTGPQALTRDEVAAAVSKVAGKPVKSVQVDDASLYKTYVRYDFIIILIINSHQNSVTRWVIDIRIYW